MTDTSSPQFSILTDTIAHRLLRYPDLGSAEEPGSALEEFASYLASEAWSTLPDSVRTATHETKESVPSESEVPLDTLSPAFVDTLVSYGIAGDDEDAAKFLYKVLAEYIEQATAPPPVWSSTRAEECEICERDVPLTYHHLIPKSVHAKALKRRWHPESMLNSVAWLCRSCHNVVHSVARCEELAQHFYTVDLLLEREDIQRWRQYAAKQRWKARPRRSTRRV